jgi:hypothetical protein
MGKRTYMGDTEGDQGPGIVLYPNWRRDVKLARNAQCRERLRRQGRIGRRTSIAGP